MSNTRFNFWLLITSIFICLFIVADAYLIPIKYEGDKIVDKKSYSQPSIKRLKSKNTYQINAEHNHFDVPMLAFGAASINDSIYIGKSIITGAKQKFNVLRDEDVYKYDIGFISAGDGYLYLIILYIFIITNLIFNKRLSQRKDRKITPYIWLVCSLLLLSFHMGLEYFFR